MISLEKVINILNINKLDIFNKYNLKELGIFGSLVKKEDNLNSDVDLIIEYSITPDLLKYIELESYIEKLLNAKVDLVIKNSIRPELKSSVLKDAIYL
ncbi:MAG: nucleotidyltransferase family protein [bacterium]